MVLVLKADGALATASFAVLFVPLFLLASAVWLFVVVVLATSAHWKLWEPLERQGNRYQDGERFAYDTQRAQVLDYPLTITHAPPPLPFV